MTKKVIVVTIQIVKSALTKRRRRKFEVIRSRMTDGLHVSGFAGELISIVLLSAFFMRYAARVAA
jgi:hypothetical protein